jgi:hypothetical protein
MRSDSCSIVATWLTRPEQVKAGVARELLRQLNDEPWPWFDEMYAAARPSSGCRFVSCRAVLYGFDLRVPQDGRGTSDPRGVRLKEMYRYTLGVTESPVVACSPA